MTSERTNRRLVLAVGAVVGVVALALAGTWFYVNVLSGDAPEPFSLDTANPGPAGNDASPASGEVALDGTWTVAEGSEAGYRVDEVLNGMDNTVVGRTSEVTGQVIVSDSTATSAEVTVDMASVTTDSGSRDGQFQGSIMNTDQYPTSTFTLTEPVDLTGLADEGETVQTTAAGELTIRDVTRPVEAQLELRRSDGTVQVVGSIPIIFEDFDVDPPNLAFVRVEDDGLVEFLLTLAQG
ncbi:YceI family protein [Phytoactinopolyspora alkaliphila]|uniref:YceI family protein n=1 Tax=Phytoactinopolyspora alkaliphila TaxID=1783498 RepID=A0A6N9YKS8_9ACTN|nr:YceI family protein [Phytoactinopolyspora alkaliphila]NED95520.1 YceI family protein [Phytoactinopolyspora alkaliphila]